MENVKEKIVSLFKENYKDCEIIDIYQKEDRYMLTFCYSNGFIPSDNYLGYTEERGLYYITYEDLSEEGFIKI